MKKWYLFGFIIIVSLILTGCGKKQDIVDVQSYKNNKKKQLIVQDELVKKIEEEKQRLIESNTGEIIDFKDDINEESDILENTFSGNISQVKEKEYIKLSQINIYKLNNARECLKLKLSRSDKLECIKKFEEYILEEKPIITLEDCNKLLKKSSKLECYDKVYFQLWCEKKDERYCNLINSKKLKELCLRNIRQWKQTIQTKSSDKVKSDKILDKVSTVKDCLKLKDISKLNCIENFVKRENDLRYCFKYLSWKLQNKCINDNYNDILKFNLKKAISTKDKLWCEKIWVDERVKKCISFIK